jgi:putative ABC transport system permease protein
VIRRSGVTRWHARIVRRLVPSLDARDAAEAADDFERLRREAWQQSFGAWAGVWIREGRALLSTSADERRRARAARTSGRRAPVAGALLYDVRQAARGLARDPRLTGFAVVTLALGIGANVTALRVADHLRLEGPAHVREPDRLLRVYRRLATAAGEQTSPWLPYQTFQHVRDDVRAFDAVGAYGVRDTVVGRGASARILRVGQTLGAFFPVLGVKPVAGRFFGPGEDRAADGPLAIVSDRVWRSDFDGAPDIVGRRLLVESTTYTIVGVAPVDFTGPDLGRVDVWILGDTRTAASYNWKVVGRLRPGCAVATASADVSAMQSRAVDDEPKWMGNAALLAAPIRFDDTAREPVQATIALWMAGVAAVILLIACANVVNLLTVRLAWRQRELAVRSALGSGRGRVMRMVALEGLMLAVAGGAASLWPTAAASPALERALVPDGAAFSSFFDARLVVIFAATVLLVAACVSVPPAIQAGAGRPSGVLRDRAGQGGARARLRSALTVLQAALSVVLLVGAGLFVRSLTRVAAIDLGTDPAQVIVAEARVDPPPVPADRAAFGAYLERLATNERGLYRRIADVVRHLPGVASASLALGLPFEGGFTESVYVPGLDVIPVLPGGGPHISGVAAGYFDTIGTRILRGRAFTAQDREGSPPVVIVNATMAARLWPGRDALGACLFIGGAQAPCARVVGIAENVHRTGLHEQPSFQYYVPFGQTSGFAGARLIVRPASASALSRAALRQAILDVDPSIRLVDLHRLSESLDGEVRPLRLGLATFGMSGAIALLVAALGLYGLMSYAVAWRRREIGIRLALGATGAHVHRLVIGGGVRLAAGGVAIGMALALAGGRWMQVLLFETSASDPVVLAGAGALLLAVALAAGFVPARRAIRIPPAESLRAD